MASLGRYAPCRCGSGKKFKFCCAGKVRAPQPDDGKLSARLLAIAGAPASFPTSRAARIAMIKAVGLGWNLAVLEANGMHDELLAATAKLGDLAPVVHEFAQRKRELFPDDLRLLLDVDVADTDAGFDVRVAHLSSGDDDGAGAGDQRNGRTLTAGD